MPLFKIIYEPSSRIARKYCDLAASNLSTTSGVLKCCRQPGGVCDRKRTGRQSLATQEKF